VLKSFLHRNLIEAGCDEAGRGCLAGPVFAAAVILPKDFKHPILNDSKKLSEKDRNILRPIIEKEALAFAVKKVGHKEIDRINILNASIKAMHMSVKGLSLLPQHLLIDGNRFKAFGSIPHSCVIKGDSIYASIAAASILAKTYRDEYMLKLHKKYPYYGWDRNKAYPTREHRDAIKKHGRTAVHRMSFRVS